MRNPKNIALTGLAVVGLTLSLNANSASICKQMAEVDCQSASTCTWIKAYERKDGRKVNAFCRAKPKSKKALSKARDANKELVSGS